MLKSDSLSTQSLASCELLLWNFQVFQNTIKRFRYKYSILFNFQGPVFASRLTGDLFILPRRPGLVKHFFRSVFKFWDSAGRSVERSDIVLLFLAIVNPLLQVFSLSFLSPTPPEFPAVFLVNIPKTLNVVSNYLTCH